MINVPTPHNEAKIGDIAKIVIMPGDPLRAKYIAENYLSDVICYNQVRNMFGYTGYYNGIRVSIQASGMGIPSMGIYSKELFEGYDVDTIIRIGSAGTVNNKINLKDIVVSESVESDSNYLNMVGIDSNTNLIADVDLIEEIKDYLKNNNISNIAIGKTFTSILFYDSNEHIKELQDKGYLAVEMETLALYANAKLSGKKALSLFTISDNLITGERLSSDDRQLSFNQMIEIALELVAKIGYERK